MRYVQFYIDTSVLVVRSYTEKFRQCPLMYINFLALFLIFYFYVHFYIIVTNLLMIIIITIIIIIIIIIILHCG